MLFKYTIVNDHVFYADVEDAEDVSIANGNDDDEWEYITATDNVTGGYCTIVFDEDGFYLGVL